MPWCPKCRNEYVEGVKVCADCGIELVEMLEEGTGSPLIFGDKEQMERLKEFLTYSGLKSAALREDKEEGVFELSVSDEERQKASLAVKVFLQDEMDSAEQEEAAGGKEKSPAEYRGVYQNSAQKAEENRSSGYLLTAIGGLGLIVIALVLFDVIGLPAAMANKFMVCMVMGALFALFFVMGILSMKSYKVLSRKAEEENSLTNEIKKWCGENMSAEKVDEGLFADEECGEELKYFRRAEKMKGMICHQFLNLDNGFLDSFIDDYYPSVFEQESERS